MTKAFWKRLHKKGEVVKKCHITQNARLSKSCQKEVIIDHFWVVRVVTVTVPFLTSPKVTTFWLSTLTTLTTFWMTTIKLFWWQQFWQLVDNLAFCVISGCWHVIPSLRPSQVLLISENFGPERTQPSRPFFSSLILTCTRYDFHDRKIFMRTASCY